MEPKKVYEYTPDVVSAPGETLLEILEDRGLTQAEFAQRTGRPKKTINEIIKGKSAITPSTAIQFERVLGIPASFWNNREYHYRQNIAERAERDSLAGQVDWVKQFPIKEMIQYGWISDEKDPVNLLDQVLRFFGIASPTQWKQEWINGYAFRKSQVYEGNPYIIETWLRQGENRANEVECSPFNASKFRESLNEIRGLTTKPVEVFHPEVIRLCAEAGVAVVFVREFKNLHMSGATRWLTPTKAMLAVNLRFKTNDQLWFSFFHEAGHILLHGKRDRFVENNHGTDEQEIEANNFAAEVLLPSERYSNFAIAGNFTNESIARYAEKECIAPGIVVGRLQHDGLIPINHFNDLKQKLVWL